MKNYLYESYIAQKSEIDAAISRVLESGSYILGKEVEAFEKEFSDYLKVDYSIGVGNGTDALQIALRAAEIGPGDEVITVSNTAVATVAAIEMAGATPVLTEIDPIRYTLDPDRLVDAINERTKAVIAVHLYGHPSDIYAIREICDDYNILLIEDCAQAHGAMIRGKKVGTIGDYGAFSFYPTKNLGALGDAGMVVTKSKNSADFMRALRQYGWFERNNSSKPGINSRLDEMQAAILRVKLTHLNQNNEIRKNCAQIYTNNIKEPSVTVPYTAEDCLHVFHQYVIQTDFRDELKQHLEDNGIYTQVHYPIPIHLQDAYRNKVRISGDLKVTERICKRIISLPIHPFLRDNEISEICDTINMF